MIATSFLIDKEFTFPHSLQYFQSKDSVLIAAVLEKQ